jgi:transcription-repair coupling factor (superfamily II helicase)
LEKAVREYKNLSPRKDTNTRIDLRLPLEIPAYYVEEPASRIELYQRIANANFDDEIDKIKEHLKDLYGPIPGEVHDILRTAHLRLVARKNGIESMIQGDDGITITFMGDSILPKLRRKLRFIDKLTAFLPYKETARTSRRAILKTLENLL